MGQRVAHATATYGTVAMENYVPSQGLIDIVSILPYKNWWEMEDFVGTK